MAINAQASSLMTHNAMFAPSAIENDSREGHVALGDLTSTRGIHGNLATSQFVRDSIGPNHLMTDNAGPSASTNSHNPSGNIVNDDSARFHAMDSNNSSPTVTNSQYDMQSAVTTGPVPTLSNSNSLAHPAHNMASVPNFGTRSSDTFAMYQNNAFAVPPTNSFLVPKTSNNSHAASAYSDSTNLSSDNNFSVSLGSSTSSPNHNMATGIDFTFVPGCATYNSPLWGPANKTNPAATHTKHSLGPYHGLNSNETPLPATNNNVPRQSMSINGALVSFTNNNVPQHQYPENIRNIVQTIRSTEKHKRNSMPIRKYLRNALPDDFRQRDNNLSENSALYAYRGDTGLFTLAEWEYLTARRTGKPRPRGQG